MAIKRLNKNMAEWTRDEEATTITRPFAEFDQFLNENPKWKKALESHA